MQFALLPIDRIGLSPDLDIHNPIKNMPVNMLVKDMTDTGHVAL